MNEIILSLLYVRLGLTLALFAADALLTLTTFRKYRWLNVSALFFDGAFLVGIALNYFFPSPLSQLIIGLTLTPAMLFWFAGKLIAVRQNGNGHK